MRWFKHISTTHQAEDGSAIIEKMGAEGYGIWWIILEVIATQMDSTEKCSAAYSAKKWGSFCGISAKRFQKLSESLAEISSISVNKKGEFLEIECCNLLKYRDEYSKKSGQSSDNIRLKKQIQNIDTDTETEKQQLGPKFSDRCGLARRSVRKTTLSSRDFDVIKSWGIFSDEQVSSACAITEKNGGTSIQYIDAVLRGEHDKTIGKEEKPVQTPEQIALYRANLDYYKDKECLS